MAVSNTGSLVGRLSPGVAVPGTPLVTFATGSESGAGADAASMAQLGNLLTANDAGFETSIGDWIAGNANTTLSWDSTHAHSGTHAAKLVSAAGSAYAEMKTNIQVGTVSSANSYTFEWFAYPSVAGYYYEADIDWYTSGGTYISSSFYSNLPGLVPANTWTRCFIDVPSSGVPATATQAVLQVQMYAPSASSVWVDDIYFGLTHTMVTDSQGPYPSLFGSYCGLGSTGVTNAGSLETTLGYTLDVCMDYAPYTSWSSLAYSSLRTNQLDGWGTFRSSRPGCKFVFGVPVVTSSNVGDFAGVVAGTYDTYFTGVAQALIDSGNPDAIVYLGWEANNPNIGPWQACDNPSGFASAFAHIVTLMRGVTGSNFKFIWSSALMIASGKTLTTLSSYYPGDSYVDYVGVNAYDIGYDNDSRNNFDNNWLWRVNNTAGLQDFRNFASTHSKPECFPEWGLDLPGTPENGGGDNPRFVHAMLSWFAQSPNLVFSNYFNADWDGTSGSLLSHFPNSQAALKARLGTSKAASSATLTSATMSGSDAAAGAEAATVAAALAASDTAAGADAASFSVSVQGADTGAGAESASQLVGGAADSASGADSGAVRPSSADTGGGSDNAAAAASAPSADTAAGSEASTVRLSGAADSGAATESAQETTAVTGADSGAGADTASVKASDADADTGAGADAASIAAAATAADAAGGSEASTVRTQGAESGSGTESTSIQVAWPVSDSGSGADAGSVKANLTDAETASGADAALLVAAASDPLRAVFVEEEVRIYVIPLDMRTLTIGFEDRTERITS